MKKFLVMIMALIVSSGGFGQEQSSALPADSAKSTGIIILDPGVSTGRPTLLLPPALQFSEIAGDTSIFALWKKTAMRPPLVSGLLEPKADLTAALRLQWAKDGELKSLRTVLGTVQLGGVAYLAYRALSAKGTPKPIRKR